MFTQQISQTFITIGKLSVGYKIQHISKGAQSDVLSILNNDNMMNTISSSSHCTGSIYSDLLTIRRICCLLYI